MFKKIEKSENLYWVADSATSKVGFKSLFKAIDYAYPVLPLVAMYVFAFAGTVAIVMSVA